MAEKLRSETVLTANRLEDGAVVYLTPSGTWSEWLDDGEVADGKERAQELLDLAADWVKADEVVDPYLMAVDRVGAAVQPLGQREIIRSKGPSIRSDLGKQAIAREG